MDSWTYQYPSTILTRSCLGDKEYASRFRGESDVLLYQLKNLMKFRKLGQLKMTRFFMDGTVITARSVFGHDFIDIDTSRSIVGVVSGQQICTITLLDLPSIVQPMKYPGEIHTGEIEGVDYIKVYYTIDVSKCDGCANEAWNLCDANVPECDQFKFVMSGVPSVVGDTNDHCIHGSCHAQLISNGNDGVGKYLIFKVFTEWSFADPYAMVYSRNGLGTMLLRGWIEDKDGNKICEVQNTLTVDCCQKDSEIRKVILWDESDWFGFPREMIIDSSGTLYKTPDTVKLIDLQTYQMGSGAFWVLPNIFGNCPPFTWELAGPGTLDFVTPNLLGQASYTMPPEGFGCNDRVTITVKDRCGVEDSVTTSPCCEEARPVQIGYTSLAMSCGNYQNFYAQGGCGPYIWSVTAGGGSIVEEWGNGQYVLYLAPSTNVNCTNNPTIQVTDCCGNSAEIKLAVNCSTDIGIAIYWFQQLAFDSCHPSGDGGFTFNRQYTRTDIKCDGTIVNVFDTLYGSITAYPGSGEFCVSCAEAVNVCCDIGTCVDAGGCVQPCEAKDARNAAAKLAGCCPLNPLTGLPY